MIDKIHTIKLTDAEFKLMTEAIRNMEDKTLKENRDEWVDFANLMDAVSANEDVEDIDLSNGYFIYGYWNTYLEEFVYIGSTTNLPQRINVHKSSKDNIKDKYWLNHKGTSIFYMLCYDEEDMRDGEKSLINHFKPRLNKYDLFNRVAWWGHDWFRYNE